MLVLALVPVPGVFVSGVRMLLPLLFTFPTPAAKLPKDENSELVWSSFGVGRGVIKLGRSRLVGESIPGPGPAVEGCWWCGCCCAKNWSTLGCGG